MRAIPTIETSDNGQRYIRCDRAAFSAGHPFFEVRCPNATPEPELLDELPEGWVSYTYTNAPGTYTYCPECAPFHHDEPVCDWPECDARFRPIYVGGLELYHLLDEGWLVSERGTFCPKHGWASEAPCACINSAEASTSNKTPEQTVKWWPDRMDDFWGPLTPSPKDRTVSLPAEINRTRDDPAKDWKARNDPNPPT